MMDTSLLPAHRPGVSLLLEEHGAALVGPGDAAPAVVNETALALWELCDGETSVEEMIDAIAALFGAPREVIAQDVTKAIADMVEADKLSFDTSRTAPATVPVDDAPVASAGPST